MLSRFATVDEIKSPAFNEINQELAALHLQHGLVDHVGLNKERFSWLQQLEQQPPYYAARAWEFPFAIIAGDLREGMKVADVGCGNTPFTAFLAKTVGPKNVTGYDPDYIV